MTTQYTVRKFGAKALKEVTTANTGVKILVSYQTPVLVRMGTDVFVTTEKFSVTTSKHISFYMREVGPECTVHRVDQNAIKRMATENWTTNFR